MVTREGFTEGLGAEYHCEWSLGVEGAHLPSAGVGGAAGNQVQMLEPAKHRHVSFLPHSPLQLFIPLLCARCFLDLETEP